MDLPFPLPAEYQGKVFYDNGVTTLQIIYYNKQLDFRFGQALTYPVKLDDYVKVLEFMHHAIKRHESYMISNDRGIGLRLRLWNNSRHDWSQQTFGETANRNQMGPLKHLAKEVQEALNETDRSKRLVEYADCLHLIFDAADRDGFSLEDVLTACEEKLKINMAREWPKPDAYNSAEAIEHEYGI